jgi:hypothetical protein
MIEQTSNETHHHQQQQHQHHHHHQQSHQTQIQPQLTHHIIPHITTLHHHHHHQHLPQQITIQQARPLIQHHQIIEAIKTEEVDVKPSIHDLISVGGMEVDGPTNNNENVHGIVVTPEIANMMSTPTQIGKECRIDFLIFALFSIFSLSLSLSHTQKYTIQVKRVKMPKCIRIRTDSCST